MLLMFFHSLSIWRMFRSLLIRFAPKQIGLYFNQQGATMSKLQERILRDKEEHDKRNKKPIPPILVDFERINSVPVRNINAKILIQKHSIVRKQKLGRETPPKKPKAKPPQP